CPGDRHRTSEGLLAQKRGARRRDDAAHDPPRGWPPLLGRSRILEARRFCGALQRPLPTPTSADRRAATRVCFGGQSDSTARHLSRRRLIQIILGRVEWAQFWDQGHWRRPRHLAVPNRDVGRQLGTPFWLAADDSSKPKGSTARRSALWGIGLMLEGYTSTTSVVQASTFASCTSSGLPVAPPARGLPLLVAPSAPGGSVGFSPPFQAQDNKSRTPPTPSAVGWGWPSAYPLSVPAT